MKTYADAGGTILFGTDVGYMSDYSPVAEYEMLAQAGLSFPRILAASTTTPARQFAGTALVGRVAPGYDADLVLLSKDPATDVRHFADVAYTVARGRVIYHKSGH